MPTFTIETTYHLPIYRQHSYEADTVEQACALAIDDDDWADDKQDSDSVGETYISGIWQGPKANYRQTALTVPSQHAEAIQRKADHFDVLLGVLKILAHIEDLAAPNLPYWLPRARAAIAKAEAILAAAPDPEGEPESVVNRAHILLQLGETGVREQIATILETDPSVTSLTADAVSDADIHTACLRVAAGTNLWEERGAAEFHAALAAIREAEGRQAAPG